MENKFIAKRENPPRPKAAGGFLFAILFPSSLYLFPRYFPTFAIASESLDFFRSAVFPLITPRFAALSIA